MQVPLRRAFDSGDERIDAAGVGTTSHGGDKRTGREDGERNARGIGSECVRRLIPDVARCCQFLFEFEVICGVLLDYSMRG